MSMQTHGILFKIIHSLAQLNGSKYCYQILIIRFKQLFVCILLNSFKYSQWLNSCIRPIDETLTGSTISGQSGPQSNDNKAVLNILQTASNYSVSSLNRSFSSNFWWLRSENLTKFTEECVMCMEKHGYSWVLHY